MSEPDIVASQSSGDNVDDHAQVIEVDKFVWNYITQSATFAAEVEKIRGACQVTVQNTPSNEVRVVLSCRDQQVLKETVEHVEQLVESCKETVIVRRLPPQENDIKSGILENLNTLNDPTSALIMLDDEILVVTGTKKEVDSTVGKLEELYGLATSESGSATNNNGLSLKLWQNGDRPVVELDVTTWQYMLKTGSQWVADIGKLRKGKDAKIVESLVNNETVVRLEVTGSRDEVADTVVRLQEMVNQCMSQVKTIRTGTLELRVYQKASKFMNSLNKSRAFVAAVSDTVSVTGTDLEISECQEKLKKLGVSFDVGAQGDSVSTEPSAAAAAVAAESQSNFSSVIAPVSSNDTTPSLVGRDSLNEVAAPPTHLASDTVPRPDSDPSVRLPRDPHSSSQYPSTMSTYEDSGQTRIRQLPVPVESHLWAFVKNRRSEILHSLRDSCGVSVETYPAEEGFNAITLQADSEDMLDCGQDALFKLLAELNETIVVLNLQTEAGTGPLPPQIGQLFSQLAAGLDAIVQISGGTITIIGPQEAANECQQRIAAFVQQQQNAVGGGGPGRVAGGPGRMGGMGGGMFDTGTRGLPSDTNSGMTMRQPGGVSLGGSGLPSGGDISEAMRNQRIQQLSTTMHGGISGISGISGGDTQTGMRSFMSDRGGMGNESVTGSMGQGQTGSFGVPRATQLDTVGGPAGVRHGPASLTVDRDPTDARPESSGLKTDDKSAPSHNRKVHFADEQPEPQGMDPLLGAKSSETSACDDRTHPDESASHSLRCSVCQQSDQDSHSESQHSCSHSFCIPCVQEYFSTTDSRCPVCQRGDNEALVASRRPQTQPRDGIMSVTFDNSFRLPGHETRSRGTIVVVYSFPPGVQQDFQPHPGRKYSGVTRIAFFPLTTEGSRIVDQLQQAFDDGRVFAMLPSPDGTTEEIMWNGIQHKTSIHGGSQLCGYPDPFYMHHVQNQLKVIGVK